MKSNSLKIEALRSERIQRGTALLSDIDLTCIALNIKE